MQTGAELFSGRVELDHPELLYVFTFRSTSKRQLIYKQAKP